MSYALHVGLTAQCPHAGPISVVPGSARVKVSGQAVATTADQFMVAGCTFPPSGTPHPCTLVQWLVPAQRVRASGQPVVLQSSTGLCKAADQAPQGAPIVMVVQSRVRGI